MKRKAVGGAVLAAVLLIVIYGWSFLNCGLQVTREVVESERVDRPVRFAVVADLHTAVFGEEQGELVAAILDERPDAVCIVGDMVNEEAEDFSGFLAIVRELAAVCPVYISWGNHEKVLLETHPSLGEEITGAGGQVLELAFTDVQLAGQRVRIGGLYEYAFSLEWVEPASEKTMEPEVYDFLREFEDADCLRIMLAHRPDTFIFGGAGSVWHIDLAISGHTHGGQIRLPFLGGLWAPDQGVLPRYVEGIHELGTVTLAITRGLGSQSVWIPRLGNPPEILVIDVVPERSTEDGE